MNRSTSSFHGCEECSFSTNYPFNLRRHVAAVHGNGDAGAEADGGNPASTTPRRKSAPSSEQAPFPCGQCGFETPYKGNLKRHVEKVHKEAEIDEEENRLEDEMEEGNFGNNVVPPPPTEVVLHPAQEVEFVARGGDPAVKQEAKASLPLLAKCQMCAFVAYTVVALREHIMSEHVSLQCAACQFTATREDLLNAHMESVHGARLAPVVIALRGRQLHQAEAPKMENEAALPEAKEETTVAAIKEETLGGGGGTYDCPTCGLSCGKKSVLAKHVSVVHLRERTAKCPLCDFTAGYTGEVLYHIRRAHPDDVDSAYACERAGCPFRAGKLLLLQRHVKTAHGGRNTFHCPHCPFTSLDKKYLKKHCTKEHEDAKSGGGGDAATTVTCPACGVSAASQEEIDLHVRLVCKKPCPLCGRLAAGSEALTEHLMTSHVDDM